MEGLIARFASWLGEEGAIVCVLDPAAAMDSRKEDLCFVVRDNKRPSLALLYFDDDLDNHSATKLLSPRRASYITPDFEVTRPPAYGWLERGLQG